MSNKATQFKKGTSGNPKGKPKGSKNRTTEEMRQVIKQIIDDNLEQLADDIRTMSPVNRANVLIKLNAYNMPTLSKNDNNNMNSGEVTIKVVYDDKPTLDKE